MASFSPNALNADEEKICRFNHLTSSTFSLASGISLFDCCSNKAIACCCLRNLYAW